MTAEIETIGEADRDRLTAEEAEELTSEIVRVGTRYVGLVVDAYTGRADKALGYRSWDAYVNARLREMPRVAPAKRREIVEQLRSEAKMPTRAIASVVGVSKSTVADDLATSTVQNRTVAEVVSLDGRRRPAQGKAKPARKSSALARKIAAAREASDELTRWPKDFSTVDEETRWEAVRVLTANIGNAESLIQGLDVAGTLSLTHCRIRYRADIDAQAGAVLDGADAPADEPRCSLTTFPEDMPQRRIAQRLRLFRDELIALTSDIDSGRYVEDDEDRAQVAALVRKVRAQFDGLEKRLDTERS